MSIGKSNNDYGTAEGSDITECISYGKPIKDYGTAESSDTIMYMTRKKHIQNYGCEECNVVGDDICVSYRAPIKFHAKKSAILLIMRC